MQFNEYLKMCRKHNHITQEQLVHDLYSYKIESFESLDTSVVSRWESGSTQPQISRQVDIIKYFQQKTGTALPCWDNYSVEEAEELICKEGMRNLIGKNKTLIYDFPSEMMCVDDMKVYPLRNSERMDALIDANMLLHQSLVPKFEQIDKEQFREWALHPDSLFLTCEYKDSLFGLFFTLKIKQDVFNKIMNFEMKQNEITINDFVSPKEKGSSLIVAFFSMNKKVATLLFIRYYARLIVSQKTISETGAIIIRDETKKIAANMNLHFESSKMTDDKVEIQSFRQTLPNVLASENVVKMLLSKKNCPQE